MSEESVLVSAFQQGDAAAFEQLVTRYQNSLTAIAYSQTGDFARSEDFAQQAFVTAWQKQRDLKQPGKFASWLRGILCNIVRNDFRKKKPVALSQLPIEANPESTSRDTNPADLAIQREQAALLWSTLEGVPETYRETLILYYREGNSVSAVAKILDISEDTVKQRLSRGRKMLKQEIAQLVDETLESGRPKESFVAGVMAAIPAMSLISKAAVPTAATVAKATTTKSAMVLGGIKMGTAAGILGGLFGSLLGIAGGVYGSKRSLDSATSDVERRYIWRMIFWTTLLVVALCACQLAISFWAPDNWHGIGMAILWPVYAAVLVVLIVRGNQRIAAIKKQHGSEEEKQIIQQQLRSKPTPKAFASNNVMAVVGASIWLQLLTGLAQDWIAFVICTIAILAIAWLVFKYSLQVQASNRLTFKLAMIWGVLIVQMIAIMIGWDTWTSNLVVSTGPTVNKWIIIGLLAVVGISTTLAIRMTAGNNKKS